MLAGGFVGMLSRVLAGCGRGPGATSAKQNANAKAMLAVRVAAILRLALLIGAVGAPHAPYEIHHIQIRWAVATTATNRPSTVKTPASGESPWPQTPTAFGSRTTPRRGVASGVRARGHANLLPKSTRVVTLRCYRARARFSLHCPRQASTCTWARRVCKIWTLPSGTWPKSTPRSMSPAA